MTHNEGDKQIEDIIDARNESGQYDILCTGIRNPIVLQQGNTRYAYSTPTSPITDEVRDDVCNRNIEGDNSDLRFLDIGNTNTIGPTDSEITLVRVKRESSHLKRPKVNNWDLMHDSAIPGDGTHLGESPSLVNLVTFVIPHQKNQESLSERNEYLVPLSSWEPTQNTDNVTTATLENLREETVESSYEFASTSKTRSDTSSNSNPSTSRRSEQSLSASKSVEKQKSSSSIKGIFKCMAFWKRRSVDRVVDEVTSVEHIKLNESIHDDDIQEE